MNFKITIVAVLAAGVLAAGSAQAQTAESGNFNRSELKKLVHDAHTGDQYATLASYYGYRQQVFERQAHAELTEWARRSQFVFGPANKYPRPVDSSRNRYEYFSYEAQQMSRSADRYQRLAASAAH